ncbi:hypothetical protein F9C11_19160 [Amycolatopsis sp. VS8301801F10]|uniref:hypothetical protein n=1 Tax=Amycolatopsis sp. VS8301801F10 TaxID=2652442 RepID=UPI0038FC50AF
MNTSPCRAARSARLSSPLSGCLADTEGLRFTLGAVLVVFGVVIRSGGAPGPRRAPEVRREQSTP